MTDQFTLSDVPEYLLDAGPSVEQQQADIDAAGQLTVRPEFGAREQPITYSDIQSAREGELGEEADRPWYESVGEGVAFGFLEATTNIFDTVNDLGNYVEEGVFGLEEDEGIFADRSARELLGIKEGQYEIEDLDTVGQVAAGMTQFGVGLFPAAKLFKVAGLVNKVAAPAAKAASRMAGPSIINSGAGMTRFRTISQSVGPLARSAGIGVVAEQLAFDPTDKRLGDALYATEIPLLQAIGDLTRTVDGVEDEEERLQLQNRLRMAAEGLGIGAVAHVGIKALTFAGKKILKPKAALDDALPDEELDNFVEITPTQVDVEKRFEELKKLEKLTVEEVEELTANLQSKTPKGTLKAVRFLKKKGLLDTEMQLYFGSINSTNLSFDTFEPYNLLKETAEILKEEAEAAGKTFPPKRTREEVLQDARLFGAENEEELKKLFQQGHEQAQQALRVGGVEGTGGVTLGAGLEGLDVYVAAARQVLEDQAEYVFAVAKKAKIDTNSVNPVIQRRGEEAMARALAVQKNVQNTYNGIPNQIGRTMNMFNNALSGGSNAAFIASAMKDNGVDLQRLINLLSDPNNKDIYQMSKALKDYEDSRKGGLLEYIKEWWYNSILSSPDTAMVNVTGNLTVQIVRTFIEGGIAAAIGQARLAAGADPKTVKTFGDMFAGLKGMSYGKATYDPSAAADPTAVINSRLMADVVAGKYGPKNLEEIAANMRKEGIENPMEELRKRTADQFEKESLAGVANFAKSYKLAYQALKGNPTAQARFAEGAGSEFVQQGGAGMFGGTFGRVVRIPTGIMSAGDVLFKSISQNRALYEEANRLIRGMKYQLEKEGKSTTLTFVDGTKREFKKEDFDVPRPDANGKINPQSLKYGTLIETLVSNPTPEMLESANKQMLEDTFQQDNVLTRSTLKLREGLNRLGGNGLFGTMLVPFVKTPLNIMLYAFDRLPLIAMANPKNVADFKGLGRDEVVARQLAGGTYLGGAITLANMGLITGGYPTDAKQRANLSPNWRPYSIKVGDKYYSYSRLDPFAMFGGFAANISNTITNMPKSLNEAERVSLLNVGSIVFKNMTEGLLTMLADKTYLKSFGEIGDIVFNPKKGDGFMEKLGAFATNIPAGAVGGMVPSVISRVGEAADIEYFYDPLIKDTYIDINWYTKFVYAATAKVPGLREDIRTAVKAAGFDNSDLAKRLFPSVDQFGEHRMRDEGFPPGVPVSRVFDPKDPSNEGRLHPRAAIAKISREVFQLGVPSKYPEKTFKIPGTNVKFDIPRNYYYFMARHQGAHYAENLIKLIDSSYYQGATENQRVEAVEAVQNMSQDYAKYKLFQHLGPMLEQMDIEVTEAMKQEFIKENANIERQYIEAAKNKAYLQ